MNLNDLRDVVSSLFVMLNQEPYILFRIEFLVVLVTLLFLAMFIMDIFRRYIHNATMKAIFSLLDAVSDSIVLYLLGAMQTASSKNQLFPVWALVLVSFRYSVDFISGYGVPDRGERRFTEYNNVMRLLGSAFLNWSRGSRFARPLWSLWALQILRSMYRFYVRNLAFNSAWHGLSSELITEYMRNWKPECDPKTMEGYRYLVYGETNRRIKLKKPRYVLYIDDTSRRPRNTHRARRRPAPREDTTRTRSQQERSSLITLDKIWGCRRHLLHHDNSQGKDLKDLSLAFALSRLLRCRLEDMALQVDAFRINRELVKARIFEEPDARRALRILELQLAFLDDYFNTRYPMVFWGGLSSLCWSLLLSVVTFGIVCWLAVDIRKVYKPPEGELAHVVHGFNVDVIITWVFMFFMMFKEIWEMVTYLLSDWTRLLLVCRYAQRKDERTRDRCMESVILSFFKCKIIARRWHGHIDQYVFLESYDDRPKFWNLLHKLTTGMVPKKEDGAKLSSAIDVPEYVMPAILENLGAILGKLADPDISSLPKDISSLPKNGERWKLYGWACFDLPTCSHIILVWHIATSLCEMELAKTQGVDLSNPGLLCSLLSCFTNCCSSKPYLMNEKKLPGELQKRYIIANSLSRYCAYLLVSKSDLIPDSFLVPHMVFQQTVKDARDDILKDCDSLQSRYDKLMEEAKKAAQEADTVKKNEDTVKMGAMLGRELIDHESEEDRWVILAGVWADLLVHIAPSWNAKAHKKCLESGGEYITHIWALLWHCGNEKSRLWPEEDVPESNAPGAPQDNCAENNNVQHVQEMRQADARPRERAGAGTGRSDMQRAGAQVRNIRNKTGAHDKDGIGSSVTETSNFRRQREKEDKWRFDIKEGSDQEDMVVVEPNAMIDRAEQSQRLSETKNAEDAGEGLVSLTSTETAGFKRGDAMSWTDLQKCSRRDTVKSRHDGLELAAIREAGSEDKQGMLTADTVDEERSVGNMP